METTYYKKIDEQKTSWCMNEVDDNGSLTKQGTLIKRDTPKFAIWAIQSEGNNVGFDASDENEWNAAVQEFRDYVAQVLD